eukprot:gene356-3713_t
MSNGTTISVSLCTDTSMHDTPVFALVSNHNVLIRLSLSTTGQASWTLSGSFVQEKSTSLIASLGTCLQLSVVLLQNGTAKLIFHIFKPGSHSSQWPSKMRVSFGTAESSQLFFGTIKCARVFSSPLSSLQIGRLFAAGCFQANPFDLLPQGSFENRLSVSEKLVPLPKETSNNYDDWSVYQTLNGTAAFRASNKALKGNTVLSLKEPCGASGISGAVTTISTLKIMALFLIHIVSCAHWLPEFSAGRRYAVSFLASGINLSNSLEFSFGIITVGSLKQSKYSLPYL